MKYMTVLLSLLSIQIATAQLLPNNDIAPIYENVPYWTTDQIVTGTGTFVVGGIVGTAVEDWTNSKILGITTSAIVGAGIGFAKDKWDHAHNTTFINTNPPYNDTLSGAFGGALGGTTIRINLFTGRSGWSKNGYNNRFRIFERKRK